MLSAEHLYQLPLELRIHIAHMDMETHIRMYLYDDEFRRYARESNAVDDFIERFVATRKYNRIVYKIGNVKRIKCDDGSEYWFKNNRSHRLDGPAIIREYGEIQWCVNDEWHRTDGPAIIGADGSKQWYINGKKHRLDGPAVIFAYGDKHWYVNDELHREDGPAVINADGMEFWYINGVRQYL